MPHLETIQDMRLENWTWLEISQLFYGRGIVFSPASIARFIEGHSKTANLNKDPAHGPQKFIFLSRTDQGLVTLVL